MSSGMHAMSTMSRNCQKVARFGYIASLLGSFKCSAIRAKERRRSVESAKGPGEVPDLTCLRAAIKSASLGNRQCRGRAACQRVGSLSKGLLGTRGGYNVCLIAAIVASVFMATGRE